MIDGRRARGLVVAVGLTSVVLLGVLRWAGRMATPGSAARTAGRDAAASPAPQAASAVPDLSFYSTLGDAPAPGRKGSASSETALRAAPGDLAPAGGVFVVQVAATGDEAQAKRMRDRLAQRGFPAAAIEDRSGAAVLWRVRVGRWRERPSAETMAEKIRAQTGLEAWVLREAER